MHTDISELEMAAEPTDPFGDDEVDRLLSELEVLAGPETWRRVEALIARLATLYGDGLERIVSAGIGAGASVEGFASRLRADPLAASLLILHGLHPDPPEVRIERALDRIRPYLRSHGGEVDLVEVDDGVVRLELAGTCRGCRSARSTIELIRDAVRDLVPDIVEVVVTGADCAAPGARGGAPLDLLRGSPRAPRRETRWVSVDGPLAVAPGATLALRPTGLPVLLLSVDGPLLAYRDRCPACGANLAAASLEGSELACPGCPLRFDAIRAGRARGPRAPAAHGQAETQSEHLEPLPLLVCSDGGLRIALPHDLGPRGQDGGA